MKKFALSFMLVLCVIFSAVFLFTACGDPELKDNTITITAENKVYDGTAIEVGATATSGGQVVLAYKRAEDPDVVVSYTTDAPTDAGDYIVVATTLETKEYKGAVARKAFTIAQKEVTVSWTAPYPLIYNGTAKMPTVEITGGVLAGDDCDVAPQVKANNDNVNAGNCTFVAVLSNSNYVVAEEAEKSYTIAKAAGYVNIPNIGKDYNGQPAVLAASTFAGDFPGGEITIEYKVAGALDNTYTTTPFTNAGSYVVRVSISESNNYLACSSTQNFSINKIYRETLRNKYKLLGEENWRQNNTSFNVGDVIVLGLLDDYGNVPEGEITFEIVDTIESTATGILNGNQLTITSVGNGRIRFVGRVSAITNYYAAEGNGYQGLNISKGTPAYTAPTGLVATYGQTLADVVLPAGFSWPNSATSVGNAGVNNFVVTYTPADTTNYNVVNNIPVTVTVSKANPVYEVPTGLVATYGDTLGSVALPAGFNWFEDTTTSVGNAGSNTFHVSYCPADTDNYNIIDDGSIAVTITVAKANPVYEVPTGLVATYGDTLGSNILPEHFNWFEDTGTLLTTIGPNVYHVTYVPADTTNYNSITDGSIAVTINVSKADANVNILLGSNPEFMYSGEPMEINSWNYDMDNDEGAVTVEYKEQGALDSTYTTTAPTNLGNYVVRVSVAESTHYFGGSQTAEFAIVKLASDVRILTSPSTTYTGSPVELTASMYGYTDLMVPECTAVVEYKALGADDNTYTTTAPTSVGQYVARVTVAETAHCTGGVATTEFTIWGSPQVLQVSLNPSVEFVVDEGKVIAVTGLNADGNRMKEEVNFIGLSELNAIKAFIDYAKEEGYLVEGANEGAIAMNYSLSGFDLSALKVDVDSYLTGEGVSINTTTHLIDKYDLVDIALPYLKEFTEAELTALNEEDILALLAQYRNDIKDFINPYLEAFYCDARAYTLTITKINAIMDRINSQYGATYEELSNSVNELVNHALTALTYYANFYEGLLLKSSNTLITTQSTINVYNSLGGQYATIAASMEASLADMKSSYETMITSFKTSIDAIFAQINSQDYLDAIDAYESDLSETLNINNNSVKSALNMTRSGFIYSFMTSYGRYNHDTELGLNISAEGWTIGVYADEVNQLTYALNQDFVSLYVGGPESLDFTYTPCYVYSGVHTAEELASLKPIAVYMYTLDQETGAYIVANENNLMLIMDQGELVPYAPMAMEGTVNYVYNITTSGYPITIAFNSNNKFYVFSGSHSKAEIASGAYMVMQVGDYTIENGVISSNEPGFNMQFIVDGENLLMTVPGSAIYFMQGQFDLGSGLTDVTIVFTDGYYVCAGHITREQAAAGAVVVMMGEYEVEGSTIILDHEPVYAPTFTIINALTGEIEMNL